MKFLFKIITGLLLVTQVFAVGEAGAIFLLIAPGAGPAGTGEAQVAKADDAYATYYNPAGLGFLRGSEMAGMHVNWLPNLADDIYYEFLAFTHYIDGIGSFGGNITYLNLGEQTRTDEFGNEQGQFKSYMFALNGSYGTQISSNSSIGLNFKVFHQKLADSNTAGETGDPFSTDFAFDVGYLKKFGLENNFNFGLAITNIGPKIDFIDEAQADPAPTNMRFGIYSKLYDDGFNKINFLLDANKLLVARYSDMDINGDGVISGSNEIAHDDPWYKAIYSAWLDDWYYSGDFNYDDQKNQGEWNHLEEGLEVIGGFDYAEYDDLGNILDSTLIVTDVPFDSDEYGIYNANGDIEKGTAENNSFSKELESMIYNMGFEYWYTENFVFRLGYIYDQEGQIKNPTFGAGIRLDDYGFDFGYTHGDQGHPRANTMFFSLNMKL